MVSEENGGHYADCTYYWPEICQTIGECDECEEEGILDHECDECAGTIQQVCDCPLE